MIFYFSATGNSRYVAERLAMKTEDRLLSVEEAMKEEQPVYELTEGERIGFVMPTYYFGLPKIMENFLGKVRFIPKGSHYVYHVLTMGGSTGNAGNSFRNAMAGHGMKVDASFSAKFPDTWTPMFDLTDREKVTSILEKAEATVDGICEMVAERKSGDYDRHKGFWRIFSRFMRMLYYRQTTASFAVNENCVGCGLCVRECPDSAMTMKDGRPVWVSEQCDFCLRCLHRCPKFAICFGKNTSKHGQYVNPKVRM